MKTQAEIQEAHDRIVQTVLGDAPNPFEGANSKMLLIAAADVLCWVLEHEHNQSFADNLKKLTEGQRALGYELVDYGN